MEGIGNARTANCPAVLLQLTHCLKHALSQSQFPIPNNGVTVNRNRRVHDRESETTSTLDLVVSAHELVISNADHDQSPSIPGTVIPGVFHYLGSGVDA